MRRIIPLAMITLSFTCLMPGCPPPAPEAITPAELPLIVGMEYALPGLGWGLAPARLPGVKFMPDLLGWGKMQTSAGAPIDFGMLDRLVKEYQGAGYAECMIGLKSESDWASLAPKAPLPDTNFAPKPEYLDDYAAWVGAVVERYDGDGVDDMPELKRPIRYYEIGVEFSTYEPEPVADYLAMLEAAYPAAHAACAEVVVLHVPFLTTTAFDTEPEPAEYETAFAVVDPRIMYHSLADIRAILDRPDVFDGVNFHCLAGTAEIEATVSWLRYEMSLRGYDKPLVISDTSPTPFAGWGRATTCEGNPNALGIVLAPAVEADRCRLADYFTKLSQGDQPTLDWLHAFVAADMVRMVIVSADQGVTFLNTSFMEDLFPLNTPLFAGAAGNGAWGGMADVTLNFFTQQHLVKGYRPLFYALQQLANRMDHYQIVERLDAADFRTRLYRIRHTGVQGLPDFFMAWHEPGVLILPEDREPEIPLSFGSDATAVTVEKLITQPGQTTPERNSVPVMDGVATIPLTSAPVFIFTSAA